MDLMTTQSSKNLVPVNIHGTWLNTPYTSSNTGNTDLIDWAGEKSSVCLHVSPRVKSLYAHLIESETQLGSLIVSI